MIPRSGDAPVTCGVPAPRSRDTGRVTETTTPAAGSRLPLRVAIAEAERTLAAAGVASPRVDAELLAAHVLGSSRSTLLMTPLVDPPVVERLQALVARRATREPLQHILGTAVLGPVEVAVGPGCSPRARRPSCCWSGASPRSATCAAPGARPVHRVRRTRAGLRGVAARRRGARTRGRPVGAVVDPAQPRRARRRGRAPGDPARRRRPVDRPAHRAGGCGRPGRLQPALRPGRDAGAARGGALGPARRGVRRSRRHRDHPGRRPRRQRMAAARRTPRDRARRHPRRDGPGAAAPPSHAGEVTEHDDLTGRPRFVTARRVPCP